MSHLLAVFAHPIVGSYPTAVLEAFQQPFRDAGYSVDVLDLHHEQFDPRFTKADHAHFWGGPVPQDVQQMHRRVEAADRLAFIYPVYWWGMPALMKGWIERVFTGGWAYQFGTGVEDRGTQDLPASLLPSIPTFLLGIAGSTKRTYAKYGYDAAMRTQIDVGTFAYCGITDVQSHLIFDIEGDHNAPNRDKGLKEAARWAREFLSDDHPVRNAKEDHLIAQKLNEGTSVTLG